MGLAFLNKKSWHTGSFKNIEQVWIAEEEHRDKMKKILEQKKKLKEEKFSEELKKIQVEAGLLPKSALEKMPWMYDVDHNEIGNNAEEYLMGKPVDSLEDRKPKFIIEEDEDQIANEDFFLLYEDPLFHMRKAELRRKQEMMNNPVKMKEILEELERQENKKKKKKKNKKEKKIKNKKSKRDSSVSKKEKKSKRKKSSNRSRSRSRSRSLDRKKSSKKKNKKRDSRESKRSRRDSKGEDSTSVSSREDKVFNNYVKKRLGPLVEFDEDTYRMRFTAKNKFKTNKRLTEDERRQKREEMMQNAEKLREEQLSKFKEIQEEDGQGVVNPEFLKNYRKEAFNSKSTLEENLNRNKYFLDDRAVNRDDFDTFN